MCVFLNLTLSIVTSNPQGLVLDNCHRKFKTNRFVFCSADSNRDTDPALRRYKDSTLDFDTLLKQAQLGQKT